MPLNWCLFVALSKCFCGSFWGGLNMWRKILGLLSQNVGQNVVHILGVLARIWAVFKAILRQFLRQR